MTLTEGSRSGPWARAIKIQNRLACGKRKCSGRPVCADRSVSASHYDRTDFRLTQHLKAYVKELLQQKMWNIIEKTYFTVAWSLFFYLDATRIPSKRDHLDEQKRPTTLHLRLLMGESLVQWLLMGAFFSNPWQPVATHAWQTVTICGVTRPSLGQPVTTCGNP